MVKNRIKVLLAQREMSRKDLARLTGLHYTTVQRFCTGKQKNVNLEIAELICLALGVDIGDVFTVGENGK